MTTTTYPFPTLAVRFDSGAFSVHVSAVSAAPGDDYWSFPDGTPEVGLALWSAATIIFN